MIERLDNPTVLSCTRVKVVRYVLNASLGSLLILTKSIFGSLVPA